MSFTGFSQNPTIVERENKKSIEAAKAFAACYNRAIGFGYARAAENKAENVYSIVDDSGKIISEYTKIHPFSFSGEDKYFVGGNSLSICEYKGFRIGTAICYDLRFPELFSHMSELCDLIIVPACWPSRRSEHWKTLLKARAIENQLYVAGINCCGLINGIDYSGDSSIFNPNGECIAQLSGSDGIICCEIENDVKGFREEFPTVADRREDIYKEL